MAGRVVYGNEGNLLLDFSPRANSGVDLHHTSSALWRRAN